MNDDITLWLAATRYYLGRRTYAVGVYCDLLIKRWQDIDPIARELIKRNVEDEFKRDDQARAAGMAWPPLGDHCDRESWSDVRQLWRDEA